MATLADLDTAVQGMTRRSDLSTEIRTEIGNAVRHYNRRASWVIERRGGEIALVAGTNWYSQIDNTAGAGVEGSPTGTAPTATDDLLDLIRIIYAKLEEGAIDWPIGVVSYREFETLLEGNTVQGTPRYITHFGGQVGVWPTPNGAHTLYLSGFYKPSVPTAGADESVWFAQYRELIENSAARRIAEKWIQDLEMAAVFRAAEHEQELLLMAEGAARSTTGHTVATAF